MGGRPRPAVAFVATLLRVLLVTAATRCSLARRTQREVWSVMLHRVLSSSEWMSARRNTDGVGLESMDDLHLRPMTDVEFAGFRTRAINARAIEKARTGDWHAALAETFAADETDRFLPDGVKSENMLLLTGERQGQGVVGYVWWRSRLQSG